MVGSPDWLNPYPKDYPVTVAIGYTAEQILELEQERDKAAEDIIARYQVHDWVAVNQVVAMPWADWLVLSPIERRAIGMCVERVAAERRERQREQEERIKSQMAQYNSRINFPVTPHSHVTDLMKR